MAGKWQEETETDRGRDRNRETERGRVTGQDAAKMVVLRPSLRVSTITPLGSSLLASTLQPLLVWTGLWTGLSRETAESQMPRI